MTGWAEPLSESHTPGLGQHVAAGARSSAAANAIAAGLGLLQLVVLARLLGPTAIGIMALATVLVEFARVAGNLGLSEAVIQRAEPTRQELSSLYWMAVLLGTVSAVLLAAVSPLVARGFNVPELAALLPVVALKLWIAGLGVQFHALIRKQLRFALMARTTVAASLAGFVVAVWAALFFAQGVWSLVWGMLVTAAVQSVVFNWYGWRRPDRPYLHFSRSDLRGYFHFGVFQSGANVLNFVSLRADQLLIGALMGPKVLGLYSVALSLSQQPAQRLLPVVAAVAFPALAAVQHDMRRLRAGYMRMLGLLSFVLLPMFVGLAAIAPVIVPLFFGPRWAEAVPLVQLLAFVGLLSSFASVSRSLTSATGHVKWDFHWNLGATLLLPPVIYVAAQTGNPVVVAASLLGLHAVLSAVGYNLILRRILGPFMGELFRAAAVPVAMALMMGVVVAAGLQLLVSYPRAVQFTILGAVGAAFYFASTFILNRKLVVQYFALFWRRRMTHGSAAVEHVR